jgi:hypothetical protein
MAVATAAQILQVFKEVYGHRVEAQANKARVLYTEFQKSTDEMAAGKYWTFPVLDEAGWGAVGSRKDGQTLPVATPESPLQATIQPKYHYATIQISGPAIAQSRTKALAFIKGMDLEVNEKTNSMLALLNRQCYNDSHGELGDVASDAANSITFGAEVNMNWFRKGMRIDIFDATLATKRNGTTGTEAEGRSITVINKTTRTIIYSGSDLSGTIVATDRVFLEDVRLGAAATDEGSEMAGLRFIIDDTTDSNAVFQNISGTTIPIWRGNRLFNAGVLRPLSLDLIQSGFDTTEVESGMELDYIISGKGQRRAYVNLLWFDARYEPQVFKGGFRVLQYAGGDKSIDWRSDKDCPPQQLIALNRASIKRYEVQALGILDHENSGTLRIAGKDVYEVLVGGYFNLGATRRNCNLRMGDLQEP